MENASPYERERELWTEYMSVFKNVWDTDRHTQRQTKEEAQYKRQSLQMHKSSVLNIRLLICLTFLWVFSHCHFLVLVSNVTAFPQQRSFLSLLLHLNTQTHAIAKMEIQSK